MANSILYLVPALFQESTFSFVGNPSKNTGSALSLGQIQASVFLTAIPYINSSAVTSFGRDNTEKANISSF